MEKEENNNDFSILMVCLGNICRSPMAEGLLRQKAAEHGLNWNIDSASTNRYHTGEAPHKLSQKVCQKNNIDISDQRARVFTAQDFEQYDLIYVMADDVMQDLEQIAGNKFDQQKVKYFLAELPGHNSRNVPDPWYGEEDGYDEVFSLIDKTTDEIINKYKKANA